MTSKEKRWRVFHYRVSSQIREAALRIELEDLRIRRIREVRALIKEDLLIDAGVVERRPLERPGRLFNALANFLDLLLEPDAAETAIGDLAEMYRQRSERSPGYAKVWLVVQVGWLVYGRAMDVYSRFTRARAGKS